MKIKFLLMLSLILCSINAQSASSYIGATSKYTCLPAADMKDEWTDSRYEIVNETTLDTVTQLMWERCVDGESGPLCNGDAPIKYTWEEALAMVDTRNTANFQGYNDWRLPNIKELASLWKVNCIYTAFNYDAFSSPPSGISTFELSYYWSSTPVVTVHYSDSDKKYVPTTGVEVYIMEYLLGYIQAYDSRPDSDVTGIGRTAAPTHRTKYSHYLRLVRNGAGYVE